jgi:Papain-like cysteine protease AvrRpt2
MNVSHFASATSRPYISLLREVNILGRLFSSKQLAFNMQAQTQSNWCWAATATSVSHFYWLLSAWTQCLVANGELGLSNCCNSSVPAACNVPWYLDRALTRTNNFVSITGQVTFQQVRDEIDAERPVGARIGWSGGGGHFMVIYGYSTVAGTDYFDIDDPIYGKSHLAVSEFANNYQGSGTWTHTYFTKRFFKMPIKLLIPIEPIRRRIWEVRPLLNLKQDISFASDLRSATEDVGAASLGMAQRVYSLGLDSLLTEQSPSPQPVNLRVYEMSGATPRAFFDVSETDQPRVLQMSASEKHLEPFARALSEVLATIDQSDKECELRLFRVPALNFEALWVNYEGDAKDVLVPLHAVGPLPQHKAVPLYEALEVLREAARPLAQMDDTMGA